MEKSCKDFEEMLVDYADGRLSPNDSSEVAQHLAKCERCRALLDGLQESLDLTGVIWADSLAETEEIRIPGPHRVKRFRWPRYATVAASILVVVTVSVVWLALTKPREAEPTVAEIEREIIESGNSARLLAATELLSRHAEAQAIVKQQYRSIVETYPETAAAVKAKSKIQ